MGARRLMAMVILVVSAMGCSNKAKEEAEREQAFGLLKGMTAEQVRALIPLREVADRPGVYFAEAVPAPMGPFESFLLIIGPNAGLCRVSAVSRGFAPDSSQSHEAVRGLHAKLEEKYGKATKGIENPPTVIWPDPMGRNTDIRFWSYPDTNGRNRLVLKYFFSNSDVCGVGD